MTTRRGVVNRQATRSTATGGFAVHSDGSKEAGAQWDEVYKCTDKSEIAERERGLI